MAEPLHTTSDDEIHLLWMRQALALAAQAENQGEVPVGAVVVHEGKIIATGFNRREADQDPCAHAEFLAIRQAAAHLGCWRLNNCTLYVTLEPCSMCAGAIVLARIPRVIYGAKDPKAGAAGSLFNLLTDPRLNHRCDVVDGILAEECSSILKKFFRNKRASKKPTAQE